MRSPYINALVASGYIGLIALSFNLLPRLVPFGDEAFLGPVLMLSLLVFSVSVMGFLFFYRPLCLALDGKREAAVGFFIRTAGTFVVVTAVVVASMVFFSPTVQP